MILVTSSETDHPFIYIMFGVYIALFTGATKLPVQTFILEAEKIKNFKNVIQWPSKDMENLA